MKRALMLSVSFVFAAWVAPAAAESSILTGAYAVTGTAMCNQSTGVLGINTTEGIYTFYSDGTGSVTETALTFSTGVIGSTATNNHTFTFKYSVNHDRSFTLTTDPGSFSATIVSGPPGAGLTVSIDQLAPITGFIGIYATTLTGATLESPLETVTYSNGNVVQRRCQRTQVYIKMHEE